MFYFSLFVMSGAVLAAWTHEHLIKKKKKVTLMELQKAFYEQKVEVDDVIEYFQDL